MPGNRWIGYGNDGTIPFGKRPKIDRAIDLAYKLVYQKPGFPDVFRDTVSKLSSKNLPDDIFLQTLDKIRLNLAEESKNLKIREQVMKDDAAARADPGFSVPPALSIPNQRDVWFRGFKLENDVSAIAASIIHEACHVAGAPADLLAEIALERIHRAAGLPR